MSASKIEWTGTTWNPTTGCDRISPGCERCFALTLAKRLKAMGSPKYQADGDPRTSGPGFGVTTHPTVIDEPLSWRTPRIVFVNSMSDISVGENRDCRRITAAHKQFTCARQLSRTEEIRSLRTSKVAA